MRREYFIRDLESLGIEENGIVVVERRMVGREGLFGVSYYEFIYLCGGVYISNVEFYGGRLGKGVFVRWFICVWGFVGRV